MFFHGKVKLATSEFSGYPKESSSPQMVSLSTGPCAPQTLRIQSHSMLSVGFSRCLNKTKRLKAAGTVSESCSASKETSWASKLTAPHHQNQHQEPTNEPKKTTWNETHLQPLTPQREKKTKTKVVIVLPCVFPPPPRNWSVPSVRSSTSWIWNRTALHWLWSTPSFPEDV